MIRKNEFIDICNIINTFSNKVNELADNPLVDQEYVLERTDYGWDAIIKLFSVLFEPEGIDWIEWWFYEKPNIKGDGPHAKTKEGNPIPTETYEDLWNLIKEYRQ